MRKISSTVINPAAPRNSLRGDETARGTGLPGAAVCALSGGRRGHGSMLPGNLPLISADAMLWQDLPTLPPERTEGLLSSTPTLTNQSRSGPHRWGPSQQRANARRKKTASAPLGLQVPCGRDCRAGSHASGSRRAQFRFARGEGWVARICGSDPRLPTQGKHCHSRDAISLHGSHAFRRPTVKDDGGGQEASPNNRDDDGGVRRLRRTTGGRRGQTVAERGRTPPAARIHPRSSAGARRKEFR